MLENMNVLTYQNVLRWYIQIVYNRHVNNTKEIIVIETNVVIKQLYGYEVTKPTIKYLYLM